MHFFSWNCTHILTRTQRKKFEDMFLIKISSKGTSLSFLGNFTNQFSEEIVNVLLCHFSGISFNHYLKNERKVRCI